MAMQDFIVLTFENCSKFYDCFNPLFINQIQKKTMWDPPRNLKNKKGKKTCSFYVPKQRKKCYFRIDISLTTYLEYLI
jgi:hypothetical protein